VLVLLRRIMERLGKSTRTGRQGGCVSYRWMLGSRGGRGLTDTSGHKRGGGKRYRRGRRRRRHKVREGLLSLDEFHVPIFLFSCFGIVAKLIDISFCFVIE